MRQKTNNMVTNRAYPALTHRTARNSGNDSHECSSVTAGAQPFDTQPLAQHAIPRFRGIACHIKLCSTGC